MVVSLSVCESMNVKCFLWITHIIHYFILSSVLTYSVVYALQVAQITGFSMLLVITLTGWFQVLFCFMSSDSLQCQPNLLGESASLGGFVMEVLCTLTQDLLVETCWLIDAWCCHLKPRSGRCWCSLEILESWPPSPERPEDQSPRGLIAAWVQIHEATSQLLIPKSKFHSLKLIAKSPNSQFQIPKPQFHKLGLPSHMFWFPRFLFWSHKFHPRKLQAKRQVCKSQVPYLSRWRANSSSMPVELNPTPYPVWHLDFDYQFQKRDLLHLVHTFHLLSLWCWQWVMDET